VPYRFLEEEATADVAFEAWGGDLDEVFRTAADATINVMIENPDAIRERECRAIALDHESLDLLLFDFLERLIYFKDAVGLLLRMRQARVTNRDGRWQVRAEGCGERLDPARHRQVVDVKAVTLHDFRLEKSDQGWKAHILLDI
jgi:SHS2 domain-containing protein